MYLCLRNMFYRRKEAKHLNSSNISNLSQDKSYLNSSNGSVKSQSPSDAKDFSKVILNAHTNPMNVSGKQVFSKNDRNQNLTSSHQREMDAKKPAKTDLSVSSSNNQKITSTSTSTCNENPTIHSKDLEKAKSDFEKDVRETLKEDLGVRDEEITKAMETLGITFQDLLTPQNLILLAGQLNGSTDSVGLLLDSGVSNLMDDMKNLVANLTQETGLSLETLKSGFDLLDLAGEALGDGRNVALQVSNEGITLPEDMILTSNQDKISVELESVMSDGKSDLKPKSNEPAVFTPDGNVNPDVTSDSTDTLLRSEIKASTSESNGEGNESLGFSFGEDNTFTSKGNSFNNELEINEHASFQETIQSTVNTEVVTEAESTQPYTSIDTRDVINQIVTRARITNLEDTHTMEMTLNPQRLGKLVMRVVEENGVIHARIQTENQTVKEALETQMMILQDHLNEKGMKVDSIEISVATRGFDQHDESAQAGNFSENFSGNGGANNEDSSDQGRRHHINLNHLDEMQDTLTPEERVIAQMMKDQGNTVNYQA